MHVGGFGNLKEAGAAWGSPSWLLKPVRWIWVQGPLVRGCVTRTLVICCCLMNDPIPSGFKGQLFLPSHSCWRLGLRWGFAQASVVASLTRLPCGCWLGQWSPVSWQGPEEPPLGSVPGLLAGGVSVPHHVGGLLIRQSHCLVRLSALCPWDRST